MNAAQIVTHSPHASWEDWWFRNAPPHALSLYRIFFGTFLLLYWGLYLPDVSMLFSTVGLAMPILDAHDRVPAWFMTLIQTPSPTVAWVAYCVLLASFACIALGVFFRTACAVALALHGYLWASSQHWSWFTMEQLSIIVLVMLSFSGAHETFSVHAWRRRGSCSAWLPVTVLPQRMIAVQVSATLLGAGWLKVVMPDWQDGRIVSNAFMGLWATPLAFWISQLDLPQWVFDVFTQGLRLFECSVSIGLWSPYWRWFLAGLAVFLVMNALLLSFWWFLILLPSYIVFFEPEQVMAFLHGPKHATSVQPISSSPAA